MKMRILTGFLFLVGLGGLVACQGAADQCTEANHCFRDDAGIPTCMEGYVWQDPDDALNLVCIGQGTAGQGGVVDGTNNGSGTTSDGTTTSGGSDNGSTGNGGAGGTGTDTDTDTSTTDSDGCPPNSHIGDPANGEDAQYCYCDEGFVVSADQTGCVEASGDSGGGSSDGGTSDGDSSSDGGSSGNCPENAHIGVEANGEDPQYCYCDEGYSVNEAGTGCEAECEVDTDCPDGNVCIDNSCRPPPCTPGSCAEGTVCDEDSGYCVQDIGQLPPEPNLSCDVLPASSCDESDVSCIPDWQCSGADCNQLIAFDPRLGDHYWDYPLNGETESDQYRSWIRGDVRNLVEYASAWVRCMSEGRWNFGNDAELGLGDMSEVNGDIPGTRENQPGHPPGTHVDGSDMDIGYYQTQYNDNRLRSICEHVQNGQDQYRCIAPPTNLDVWRSALVLAKMHDNPNLRVIGVDGQAGALIESAITQMCSAGWISGSVCSYQKIAYELTDGGAGWYRFHHHHFHISVSGGKSGALNDDLSLVPANFWSDPLPEAEQDPRRALYRELKMHMR